MSIHTLEDRGGGERADSGGGALGFAGETWGWVTSVPASPCNNVASVRQVLFFKAQAPLRPGIFGEKYLEISNNFFWVHGYT
jgi:hypothetical protein